MSKTFRIETEKIQDAYGLMSHQTQLTSWNGDLPNLVGGTFMFKGCEKLNSFQGNLDSLQYAIDMFDGTNIASFSTPMPSLRDAYGMFRDCSNLQSFHTDISHATNTQGMFQGCYNLSAFGWNLNGATGVFFESTNARAMFKGCSQLTPEFAGFGFSKCIHNMSLDEAFYGVNIANLDVIANSLTGCTGVFKYANIDNLYFSITSAVLCNYVFQGATIGALDFWMDDVTQWDKMFYNASLGSVSINADKCTNFHCMFCDTGLSSFTIGGNSFNSNVTDLQNMFYGCKLTKESLLYLVDVLRNTKSNRSGNMPQIGYVGVASGVLSDPEVRQALLLDRHSNDDNAAYVLISSSSTIDHDYIFYPREN